MKRIFVALLLTATSAAQANPECQVRTVPIKPPEVGIHEMELIPKSMVTVLDFAGSAIRVRVPASPGKDNYLQSVDGGKSWQYTGEAVASVLTSGSEYFYQPSRAVQWFRLSDGHYLRTDEGKKQFWERKRWVLPHYELKEKPGTNLADRLMKDTAYDVQFNITAMDPRNPLHIFSSIEVKPWLYDGIDSPDQIFPGLYESFDGGDSWSLFSRELAGFARGYRANISLAISPSNPDIMYGLGGRALLKSTDAGKSWARIADYSDLTVLEPNRWLTETLTPLRIREIAINPKSASEVYLVSDVGIFRSLDAGASWDFLTIGNKPESVTSLAINRENPGTLIVGTKEGLFRSDDQGCHFTQLTITWKNSLALAR